MTCPEVVADADLTVHIAPMQITHWPEVRDIYAAGIATGEATLEVTTPTWAEFDQVKLADQRFVALDQRGQVLGWIGAAQASRRQVYAGVVEHSIYVRPQSQGKGVGRKLLQTLITSTETQGIWTIECTILPENKASLALHRALGFRTVGKRENLGKMRSGRLKDQWITVLLLERRSQIAGVN